MKMEHLSQQLVHISLYSIGPGEDYTALPDPFVLRFGSCQKRQCSNVTIINDDKLEGTESFNVSLEAGRGVNSRFVFDPQEVSVTITDKDGV